jgi:L-serine dehydratase
MRAANAFIKVLLSKLNQVTRVKITLYGSLAHTGRGHGTDKSIILGLMGIRPEVANAEDVKATFKQVQKTKKIKLLNNFLIPFDLETDMVFNYDRVMKYHPNAMLFEAWIENEMVPSYSKTFYSIGGGFILDGSDIPSIQKHNPEQCACPYPFKTANQLIEQCRSHGLSIPELILKNEQSQRSLKDIKQKLLTIAKMMEKCIYQGLQTEGVLPGPFKVTRRAPKLYKKLQVCDLVNPGHQYTMNWLNTFAIAVGEENASGGRVVTAPTNGAAGVLPAVLSYYKYFTPHANDTGVFNFLLTSGAIGILYKQNASISGAELGCQAEIGVACSMAAGGLVSALGGTLTQIEHAAEIGMEHNLGLTCDPVGGLVQIPCIERNAMGACKAVSAANLALIEDGSHKVSLDVVMKTMVEVGQNMNSIYKETSKGGLATILKMVGS